MLAVSQKFRDWVARLPSQWRRRAALACGFIWLTEIAQAISGYWLAWAWAPIVFTILSILTYVLVMLLLWNITRVGTILGLAIPAGFLLWNWAGVLMAVLFFPMNPISPAETGRISPTASYRIIRSSALLHNGSIFTAEVYRNPKWFPLIAKQVGSAHCGNTEGGLPDVFVIPGTHANSVRIVCEYADIPPVEIHLN